MFDDDLLHPIGSLAHGKLPPFLLFAAALAMRFASGKRMDLRAFTAFSPTPCSRVH
jgi:hypothetical protein